MEDDDGEGSNTESQVLTDSESLKIHQTSTTEQSDYSDDAKDEDEEDEEEEEEEIYPENFPTRLPNPVSHPVFKGLKRKLLSPQNYHDDSDNSHEDDNKIRGIKRGKISEYVQYLGLQPAPKYKKCLKCSVNNYHHTDCICKSVPPSPQPPPPPPPPPRRQPTPPREPQSCENIPSTSKLSNNFRITRKVYMCASCDTYFENWNLFLHMRDIHKRHICLYCLGLFDEAERLSHHLENKHSVKETKFSTYDDFNNAFKGSCYLICCSCEKLFTETDNFYNHYCPTQIDENIMDDNEKCSVCRGIGGHSANCQRKLDVTKELQPKNLDKLNMKNSTVRSKNNRMKRSEKHMLTSYQRKLTELYARKMNMKSEKSTHILPPSEPTVSGENSATELRDNSDKSENSVLSRDTVAETIMEVSKCSDKSRELHKSELPQESPTVDDKPEEIIQEPQEVTRNNWDSVTETIMRVSRLNNDSGTDKSSNNDHEPDKSPTNHQQQLEQLPDDENKLEEPDPDKLDTTSSSEDDNDDDDDEERENNLDKVPMSVSSVNRTKGSLVIKICTNKNSHYSVTTPNVNGIDESDDNNNGSDSDNDRLTVAIVEDNQKSLNTSDEALADRLEQVNESQSAEAIDTSLSHMKETEDHQDDNQPPAEPEEQQASAVNVVEETNDNIFLASEDVPVIDLNVNDLLENLDIIDLMKGCIESASPMCVYCNHARHIAVNGKQLALHMLAEHRFQPQHPAIIIDKSQFIVRVKKSIDELDERYFNYDSYDSNIGTYNVPPIRIYECFHCRVTSHIHKDLYLHNRKMHQKTILICIMCKSTFYSYSELLCHLCPGIYTNNSPNQSIQLTNTTIKYRCCICTINPLPSSFRLMVHLRKSHHACDVCLELTGNQQKLSNHVWKHKLHHLCYRCGIAYRNKPDITKHLFWKHGTESVVCKKCLQKKWPHIYHFCIPPSAFVCDDCNLTFKRAVSLKVHKRLHTNDQPYCCSECEQRFISKKLMIRHEEDVHRPQPEVEEPAEPPCDDDNVDANGLDNVESIASTSDVKLPINDDDDNVDAEAKAPGTSAAEDSCPVPTATAEATETKATNEPVRKVVDVYDLPPLNLSSESDSDDDEEKAETKNIGEKSENDSTDAKPEINEKTDDLTGTINEESICDNDQIDPQEVNIMNGIWNNFKSYATTTETNLEELAKSEEKIIEAKKKELIAIITDDHDYCIIYGDSKNEDDEEVVNDQSDIKNSDENGINLVDNLNEETIGTEEINELNEVSITADNNDEDDKLKSTKSPKKKSNSSSSDSSSDSDSSSCSCGTNCSCSSSSSDTSSSSSNSSDSDSSDAESSPRKQPDRKKEHKKGNRTSPHKRAKESNEAENKLPDETDEIINVHTIDEKNVDVEVTAEAVPFTSTPVQPKVTKKKSVMRESDLDTDETDTDEDFYDEHPQELANKILAEKRNQLMLLASVAPAESSLPSGLNNGVIDNSTRTDANQGKKVKVKKRKKGSDSRRGRGARGARGTRGRRPKVQSVDPIKLNIPNSKFNRKKPRISFSSMVPVDKANDTESSYQSNHSRMANQAPSGEGQRGQDGDNKRSSKRKRIPKKFYGDSSDDEQQQHHVGYPKWRRVETNQGQHNQQGQQYVPTITIKQNFGPPLQSKWYNAESEANFVVLNNEKAPSTHGASVTDTEDVGGDGSSDSSSSESSAGEGTAVVQEQKQQQPTHVNAVKIVDNNLTGPTGPIVSGDKKHLYCYCQCPYDEVSEMIACDGNNCKIEWFHFECVGIMVPPKGKWYCPDCRRDDPTLKNDEFID